MSGTGTGEGGIPDGGGVYVRIAGVVQLRAPTRTIFIGLTRCLTRLVQIPGSGLTRIYDLLVSFIFPYISIDPKSIFLANLGFCVEPCVPN